MSKESQGDNVQAAIEKAIDEATVSDPGPENYSPEPKSKEPVQETPPPAPKHPAWLTRQARDYGISADEAAEYTYDQLKDAIDTLGKQRQYNAASARHDQPQLEKLPVERKDPLDDTFKALRDEGFDERIVSPLETLRKENAELREAVEGMSKREVQRENARLARQLDRVFQEFDIPSLGNKPGESIRGTPEYERRLLVINAAAATKGPGSLESKVRESLKTLFGDEPKPDAALEARKQEWAKAGLQQPTPRAGKEPKGERRAQRAVAQLLGQQDEATGNESYDNLPD